MKKYLLILFTTVAIIGLSHAVFADTPTDYKLLAPIPGIDQGDGTADIATYLPALIKTIIGLATGVAVLLVMYGGAQYLLSTIPNVKANGRKTIQDALVGLVLLSVSWIILYTINPKLVQFSLKLDNVGSTNEIDTGLPTVSTPTLDNDTGAEPGGSSGSGNIHASAGTNNCGANCKESQTFGFPQKAPGAGCQGSTCYIDPALGQLLETINKNLGNTGRSADKYAWIITEMTPPTVNHLDSCHGNGTCVDASIIGLSSNPTNADAIRIITLLSQLDNTPGITYEYEACGSTLTALRNNIYLQQYASKIKCESTTQNGSSGQSLHIDGPNANNTSFSHGTSGTF